MRPFEQSLRHYIGHTRAGKRNGTAHTHTQIQTCRGTVILT